MMFRDRGRELRVGVGRVLADRGRELLDEERVSLGRLRQPCRALAENALAEEPQRELLGGLGAQRLEGDRGVRPEPAAPVGPGVDQVRTREREQQHRHVLEERAEGLDQVEQAAVRPVDVLEDEDERLLRRQLLDQPPDGEEERAPVRDLALGEADEDRDVRRDLLGALADEAGDGFLELAERHRNRVGVEDSGDLHHLLGERLVPASGAVGQGAPLDDAGAVRDLAQELVGEPGLPDPGNTEDGDEVRAPLLERPRPGDLDRAQLGGSAHERGFAPGAYARHQRRVQRKPRSHRLALALDGQRLDRLVRDHGAR